MDQFKYFKESRGKGYGAQVALKWTRFSDKKVKFGSEVAGSMIWDRIQDQI